MVIRSPFARDFAIITGALVLAGSVLYALWAIRGPDSLPTFFYGVGRYALGAVIIGCLAAAGIRCMGRSELWKDVLASSVPTFAWTLVTGMPTGTGLLSALFCAAFLSVMLKKNRGWLGGSATENPQINSPS